MSTVPLWAMSWFNPSQEVISSVLDKHHSPPILYNVSGFHLCHDNIPPPHNSSSSLHHLPTTQSTGIAWKNSSLKWKWWLQLRQWWCISWWVLPDGVQLSTNWINCEQVSVCWLLCIRNNNNPGRCLHWNCKQVISYCSAKKSGWDNIYANCQSMAAYNFSDDTFDPQILWM